MRRLVGIIVESYMPKISVLTATCHNDYLPYQVRALQAQSFREFEWVIVDDNYDKDNYLGNLIGNSFPFTHIPPREFKPYVSIALALNSGLVYCSGKVVFFMCDYIIPDYECLARHWEIHEKYPRAIISGRSISVDFHPSILESGIQDKFMGSDYRMGLFDHIFDKS